MRKYLDKSSWSRTYLFELYRQYDFPYINIGCQLDISKLYKYAREEGLSLYFSLVFAATRIADEIENFRYRFEGDQPFVIDANTAFATHLPPGEELFTMVECDRSPTMREFALHNRKKADIKLEQSGLSQLTGRLDIINFTCIPWVDYTHFVRTVKHQDCVPKMSIGKFEKEGEKVLLPFSTQTHHGLTDGYHVGMYFERLQEYIADEGWKR